MKLEFEVGNRPLVVDQLPCEVCGRIVTDQKDLAAYIITPAAMPADAPIRTWGKYFDVPPAKESCRCVDCVGQAKTGDRTAR